MTYKPDLIFPNLPNVNDTFKQWIFKNNKWFRRDDLGPAGDDVYDSFVPYFKNEFFQNEENNLKISIDRSGFAIVSCFILMNTENDDEFDYTIKNNNTDTVVYTATGTALPFRTNYAECSFNFIISDYSANDIIEITNNNSDIKTAQVNISLTIIDDNTIPNTEEYYLNFSDSINSGYISILL